MTHPRVLILHGISSIRTTGDAEVTAALTDEESRLSRTTLTLDTRAHEQSVASGFWGQVDAQVRTFAAKVLADIEERGPATLLYVGIDEVSTLIALGAFIGDEHRLACRDYDRDRQIFRWSKAIETLAFESLGVPTESVDSPGNVVLRIEVTYPVQSRDVDEAVGNRLADITIRPKGVPPKPGLLRSQGDVEALRHEVRAVLARIERTRPSAQTIHLFLAGPVSACLAVGQELRLRNGRRVQTYRYRSKDSPPQTRAILLTPEAMTYVQAPLTPEQLAVAKESRQIWTQALADINTHAIALRANGAWPSYLIPELAEAAPRPGELDSIWNLVSERHLIADDDVVEFRFDRDNGCWYLPDRMLLAMNEAAGGEADRIRRLARAFLWHEYLHEYQNLTENTAVEVGGFPNCLERLDYIADVYGTLHQVDFVLRGANAPADWETTKRELRNAITEAIDAFWTFEESPPIRFWQTRRLRRYLNWYWRREQIIHAKSLAEAIDLLCEPPVIEIAGPAPSVDTRRYYADLERIRPNALELALVDRNNKLQRFPTSTNLPISELLEAFRMRDRTGIDRFFTSLIEHARQRG